MDEKNQVEEKPKSFRQVVVLQAICLIVWLLGIFFYYLPLPKSSVALSRAAGEANIFDAFFILVSVIGALAIFYFLRRKRALAPAVSILFGIVIFNTMVVFIEPLVAFTVSVLLVFLERMYRSFVSNNLLIVLGVFAAAISFVSSYSVNFLLILIGLFAIYDIVGVFWWKAIPKVAKNAAKNGTPLILLIPKKNNLWLQVPTPDTIASMLGAGDLFIPLIFLSATSFQFGYSVALVSLAGALLGNVGNFFLVRKIKGGIPAVPLLAIGLAAGYGLGLLIF
ncbi:MAG: presenilin family intramembrane aspartyl protease [Patescibacteria group bacterium]